MGIWVSDQFSLGISDIGQFIRVGGYMIHLLPNVFLAQVVSDSVWIVKLGTKRVQKNWFPFGSDSAISSSSG